MTNRTRSAWFFPEEAPPLAGWLCFDAECAVCTAFARRLAPVLASRGFALEPLQSPWVRRRLHLRAGEPPAELVLIEREGGEFGGADAVARVARSVWWAWPLWLASRVPLVRGMMKAAYEFVAARRHRLACACAPPE